MMRMGRLGKLSAKAAAAQVAIVVNTTLITALSQHRPDATRSSRWIFLDRLLGRSLTSGPTARQCENVKADCRL
jgi:hypothetical protein